MTVYLTTRADKELRQLPGAVYRRILNHIEKLTSTPFPVGSVKLVARPGRRVRVGDYRILYTVDGRRKEMTILSVAHRRDAYRN